ncbi:MAG: hypothetical protein DRJ09_02320 [Bacteroidetes bacterium]|nr:MAG: hypothetical protein DRJ09_02320 [Bacteroidota bacterium]
MNKLIKYIKVSTLVVLLVFANINLARAQEMLGLTMGNYAGSLSALSNPGNINQSKIFFDIHLTSVALFARNNFAYIPKNDATLYDLFLKSSDQLPVYGKDNNHFTYYNNHDLKFAQVNVRVQGPSAMFYSERHGFGISTAVRFFTSGNRIPWEIPVVSYEGLDYDPLHNIQFNDYSFDVGSSAWFELGLTYAYDIIKYNRTQLTAGITVKPLYGLGGIDGTIQNGNYIILDDSTVNFLNVDTDLGYALPIDYDDNTLGVSPTVKGSGLGIDIGVVYSKKRNDIIKHYHVRPCEKPYDAYIYRIGFSLLDIGRVNYKYNSQLHSFENVSAYWPSIDTTGFQSMNSFVGNLSGVFYGTRDGSFRENNFKVGLPTAASFQGDFYLFKNIYLNTFWIHPIKLYKYSLRRNAVVAISPRFETKWFEVSVPVSLYNYKYPRVGLAVRFLYFTIGTERLGTYLGMADLNGMDIYGSIKINFTKGGCKFKGPNKCLNYEYGISEDDHKLYRKRNR